MLTYWQALHDSDNIIDIEQQKVLHCGSLLYRENDLASGIHDLYIRSCYDRYYNLTVVQPMRYTFFTGTPGLGKSCFRTYMMWRQIQHLKQINGTGIIWACKAPSEAGETVKTR